MPGNMSVYLENAMLNRILKAAAWTPVATPYLALFTALTGDAASVTEVSTTSTGYGRISCAFNAASANATANTSNETFTQATAGWGTMNYWGLYDASTGGNLLYWGPFSNPLTINSGEIMQVNAGDLTINLTGNLTTAYANSIINTSLRGSALAAPAGLYTALLTAFTNDATYTECSDSNYARQSTTFGTVSAGAVATSADLVWAAMNAQQVISHGAIFDAVTVGNMIFRGTLGATKTIDAGKVFKILSTTLNVTLD